MISLYKDEVLLFRFMLIFTIKCKPNNKKITRIVLKFGMATCMLIRAEL